MSGLQTIPLRIENNTSENGRRGPLGLCRFAWTLIGKCCMDGLEQLLRDNSFMVSRESLLLVRDQAAINRIVEDGLERTPEKRV